MIEKIVLWVLGAASAGSIIFGVVVWGDRQFLYSDLAAAQDDLAMYKNYAENELAQCRGER